ncbi:hypothetical protein L218DRAFT_290307 [Marasmius fiardii PR-910]|nr:hypothetical protein L218DRAFT_290307 [Marasmius fiardii PR-910]
MQIQLTENKHTIRAYKKQLKNAQNSALEEQEVSMAKEVSAQDLQLRLERSRAEIQELRDHIALLEGRDGRRSYHHRDKGKGREVPLLDSILGNRQRNPLPAPPQPIPSNNNYYLNTPPLDEDNDPDLAIAIAESMRHQQPHYALPNGSVAGPSRIPAVGTSHTIVNGRAGAPSIAAMARTPSNDNANGYNSEPSSTRNPHSRGSQSNPRYQQSTPSPPRRTMMPAGASNTERIAPDTHFGPSVPSISEHDLFALRKSVQDMNLQQSEATNRKAHTRKDRARDAARQEEIRGVTGLGLINENLNEPEPQIYHPQPSVTRQNDFEFPGARAVSVAASASSRPRLPETHHPPVPLETRLRQAVTELHPPRHRALARDPDRESLLSNDTTGTWHSIPVPAGETNRRRSMNSDILNSLATFPTPSDRRSSISSVASASMQNAFLPPIPPPSSRGGTNTSSVPSRAGDLNTSFASASSVPVGSANTSLGFYVTETPRPGYPSTSTSSHPQPSQPTRDSGGRPRPLRNLTQPIPVRTDTNGLRGSGRTPVATLTHGHFPRIAQAPPNTHESNFPDVSAVHDPQPVSTEFGNALGLDLSQDLGSVEQQALVSAQANPHLLAPTPRAPHHQFLRSFSDGL